MSDQNLEYTLDISIDAAQKKLESLFGGMEKTLDTVGKAVGKKLKENLVEQQNSAKETSRQLQALDRAVQSNLNLVDKLAAKYEGLGNTRIDGLVKQLQSLTNTRISPELQKLMDNRAATPAGMLKTDTKGIMGAINQEVELHNLSEQAKADILQKEQNELRLAQTREKIISQLTAIEDKTRKYSQEHSQSFAAMRNDVESYAKTLMNETTASNSSLELNKQRLESLGKELQQNATIRMNAAKEAAAAEKTAEAQRAKAATDAEAARKKQIADADEQKVIQQRIKDNQALAVETAKFNEEKYGSDKQYRDRVQKIYEDLQAAYAKLAASSTTMTSEQVSKQIQIIERAAQAELAVESNLAQKRAQLRSQQNASLGRFSSNLYMVQQTVEDFSYAGFRGASNNLAFMASTIAGPAGTAAMVGMLGAQLLYSTGALKKFDEALGISEGFYRAFGIKTKEQIERLKEEAELYGKLYDARRKAEEALAKFQVTQFNKLQNEQAIADRKIEIELRGQEVIKLERLKASYDAYTIAKERASSSKASVVREQLRYGGASLETVAEMKRLIAEEKRLLASTTQIADQAGFSTDPDAMSEVNKRLIEVKQTLKTLNVESENLKTLQERFVALGGAAEVFNKALRDAQKFSKEQLDTTGMTSKGSDQFSDTLRQRAEALQKLQETERKLLDDSGANVTKNMIDASIDRIQKFEAETEKLRATQQFVAKEIGDQLRLTEEKISATQREISSLEKLIEKEKERKQIIADQRSAFEDNAAKRQMSAADKIDDLKLGEQNDALKEQYDLAVKAGKARKDWFLQEAENRAEWAKRQMGSKGSIDGIGHKDINQWLENQRDWANRKEQQDTDALSGKFKQQMDAAEKANQASKQGRLDKLKEQLGGKAQDLTAEARKAMEGGNFETASEKLKQAMRSMEELQQAQEKTIGKVSSKQAEQIEKDLKGSSDKMRQLFDLMDEVSEKNRKKLEGNHADQLNKLRELEGIKLSVEAIDIYTPDALKTLETLKQQLMEIADIKGQISAIPLMPAGGALMAGGFGAGGSTINSSITMNMNGATPMAAMAAAKATVASMALQRA